MTQNRARTGGEPYTTGAGMTFDEIAERLGISKQRVWMIYCSALRKLRRGGRLLALRRIREEAAAKDYPA